MTMAAIIADAADGDELELSRYIKSPVQVVSTEISMAGRVLLVESTGGTTYRLRAVDDDDDDRLLLEKRADDGGWNAFIRLTADRV